MALYHKDVFMPRRIKGMVPTGIKQLTYTRHARQACSDDRYGVIPVISTLDLNISLVDIVEVEVLHKQVNKIVVRVMIRPNLHAVLVLLPCENKQQMVVKTCWINTADDKHETLRRNMYEQRKPQKQGYSHDRKRR